MLPLGRPFLAILLGVVATSAVRGSPIALDTKRNITYHGANIDGVEHFLNIRFGQDTGGHRRFAPPLPFYYESRTNVNATVIGAACPQNPHPPPPLSGNLTLSEDCLSLRIARPENTTAEDKLPVMVWIYGGSDEMGQAYDQVYNPTYLVENAAKKGFPAIYVAINYRVNIFGFANTQSLANAKSLNLGLLDQRLALEWVQRNIAYFGGDNSSVTIVGESDGGAGVGLQLTAHGGKGRPLFHRAIMQSGDPTAGPGVSGSGTRKATEGVIARTRCHNATSEDRTLACLRALPMQALVNAWLEYRASVNPQYTEDVFYPTVDGSFIPRSPSTLIRNGEFNRNVSVIAGWNYNDASLFVPPNLNTTLDTKEFLRVNYPSLTDSSISRLLQIYPLSEYLGASRVTGVPAESFRSEAIFRDMNFACPAIAVAAAVAAYGGQSYLYEFNQTLADEGSDEVTFQGVYHTSDIPFVFNYAMQISNRSAVERISSEMSGSWAHFAATGTPSSGREGTLPGWIPALSPFSGSGGGRGLNVQVIGGAYSGLNVFNNGSKVEGALTRRCAFVNSPGFQSEIET